ncbi:pro-sigmaK processing inhibitor BofA family protein [Clostridium cochlearium]|uniref:pro-sigmaK processing inhibitor BofA family protein n=1 Tax=Clostridium cochlearium TaxID=1494 RepID=UPI000B7D2F9A|nr:pro-sigmaK processing inhibitor BofA family protein [Clostridium cochlearium]MBE6065991.1 pro-sigmaK processing inhibitor BofA [Clostridium cochlearium]MBU5270364.1 pro-sigmaK processing inhibitor BofA family protein [Clostridium cochlearium]MCG4572293.1 pro-sigmaK processing inhibitor BofA family protein [Clostridium cochlearium]MCG4580256.1 pro-sigmaK processing inhibitor BofA family protein [Clostridium cochlearium]MCR1972460.1 pro-sigmaK processing inhibitor BofA family protein [Clostri
MILEYIGYFILAILGLVLIVKIFAWPLAVLTKLIINGIVGAVLLVLVNAVGGLFNIQIGINAVTALIAGFFGVPGVIFLIIFDLFL